MTLSWRLLLLLLIPGPPSLRLSAGHWQSASDLEPKDHDASGHWRRGGRLPVWSTRSHSDTEVTRNWMVQIDFADCSLSGGSSM